MNNQMIKEAQELILLQPSSFLLAFLSFVVLFFWFGGVLGNVTSMKLLARMKIPMISGNPYKDYKVLRSVNKDGIGWIKIAGTCYAPIMKYCAGKYKKQNFLKQESFTGELYLSESRKSDYLKGIAKENVNQNTFSDMSMIIGSDMIRTTSIKKAQFTFIHKYIKTESKDDYPNIILIDNGRERVFNLLFVVQIGIENRKELKFSNRDSFIESMRTLATYDSHRETNNDIVILNATSELDSTLVFLVEVQ